MIRRAFFPAGRVEREHRRVQILTLPMRVERTPIKIVSAAVLPFARRKIQMRPVPGGLVRFHAGAADFGDEQTADSQCVVAHHLGIDAEPSLPAQPAVFRVELAQPGGSLGRLAVRSRQNDELNDVLDVPSGVDELAGQPVQEKRMAGQAPWAPKSSTFRDSPVPKASFHMRLAKVRAVSGFSGDVSQRAKSARVSRPSCGQAATVLGEVRV